MPVAANAVNRSCNIGRLACKSRPRSAAEPEGSPPERAIGPEGFTVAGVTGRCGVTGTETIAGVRAEPVAGIPSVSPPARRAVAAWAAYELALALFSINIVSLYFPLWIVDDMGGSDGTYGLANSASMALLFFAAPLLGALSDQAPRRVPFLVVATLVCAGFTALLGVGGLALSLACFVVANAAQQSAVIFSDALLPAVSTPTSRGKIGGIGVAVSNLGAVVGIGTGLVVLGLNDDAKPLVFKLTAGLVLLFALPCFRWVPEPARADMAPDRRAAISGALAALRQTAARARRAPSLTRFLVGRVFYSDAANTLTAFMAIYATKEIGFSDAQTQLVLLAGIAAGIGGGLVCGRLVDRIGPKRTLDRLLGLWVVVFVASAAIPVLELPRGLFWLVAPLAGFSLGGAWAADRPLMLRLSPPDHLGQFYGLYAMVGRFSAIVGPLLWTAIVDWLGWGRPAAVLSLALMTAIGFLILRPVRDEGLRAED